MIHFTDNPTPVSGYLLTRRRFIPNEYKELRKDHIYHVSPDLVVTAWQSIHSRPDLLGGLSAFYPKLGVKVSKLYDHDKKCLYWYCDIIRMWFDEKKINYEDLLLDVVLMPDGQLRVLDADELADALEQGLITPEAGYAALRQMNHLLTLIYSGRFSELQQPVLELEEKLYSAKI